MVIEENKVYCYDKHMNLLALFDRDGSGLSPEQARNLLIGPRITIAQNGESTFSFQMMAISEKFQLVKDPENIWEVNGRRYTPLNERSIEYTGDGSARIANCTFVELQYLLDRQYHQIYCCGLYCYAKATFQSWTNTGAVFRITSSGCSNPGNTISSELAWHQVRLWQPKDKKGNDLTYTILKSKEYAPTGWKDAPASVAMTSFSVSGNTATMVVKARSIIERQQSYDYVQGGTYQVESRPYPASIEEVAVNTTVTTDTVVGDKTTRRIVTSNKKVNYSYNSNTGRFSINYNPAQNEEINHVIALYSYYDMGEISPGATCYFAYGAETIDEHTVLLLPKADKKYKLTIDGVEYEDSQVRDSRGVIMPRGSAGYAMWALLKNTGWQLGICDVIAKGFNSAIDFGCFNVESDMKDTFYNCQCVADLYGGILSWRSKEKILDFRAENDEDYDAYNDGFNDWTGYEFREGKNIKDQPNITVDNNLITKGYVLGYGNLNIKKVNGGKSYVTDYSYTTDTYEGYLEQPLIYDTNDEGGQRQLLYWGQKEIKKKSRPRKTISYNVVDVRTVEGYEHETFQINDVCRAYWRDTETGEEKFELKRIIKWEYNPFALWDSTVELGDKTANFSEIFKLIYNSAVEESPKTNAMGKISSDEIVMEFDISEFGFDDLEIGEYEYPNYSYTGGVGGYGGYGYGSTLSDYISLIARKTTENSDAVAGLIIEANDLYAQTELFSQYQKRTDDRISETYAGLKTYADEWGSTVSAEVRGNYETIQRVDGELKTYKTTTDGAIRLIQEENRVANEQILKFNRDIYDYNGKLETSIRGVDYEIKEITENYARRIDVQQFITDSERRMTEATNNMIKIATKDYATTQDLTRYATLDKLTGELKVYEARIEKWAGKDGANVALIARDAKNAVTVASTAKTEAERAKELYNSGANRIVGGTNSTYMYSPNKGSYFMTQNGGYAYIVAGTKVVIQTSSLSLLGFNCSWKSATINGTTINYLGR